MKKILSLIMVVVLLVVGTFILTGCENKGEEASNTETGNEVVASSPAGKTDGWKAFYDKYSDLSDKAYENLESNTESFDILKFISGDIDLAFCTSFFTNNDIGVKTAFGFFGYTDINYVQEPKVETLAGINSEGKNSTFKLEFDNEVAKLTYTVEEEVNMTSIFIKENEWAKSYSSPKLTVQIYQEGENVYFGYDDNAETQYIEAKQITKDSVISMPKYMQLENGAFTSK